MTQNDIIGTVMKVRGISSKAEFAEIMGISTRQQFGAKMDRMTIRVNEMIDALEKLRLRFVVEDMDTGEMYPIMEDVELSGIRKMVCGVYRNSKACVLLGTRETENGKQELLQDPKDGAYLLATYGNDGKNRLKKLTEAVADELMADLKKPIIEP